MNIKSDYVVYVIIFMVAFVSTILVSNINVNVTGYSVLEDLQSFETKKECMDFYEDKEEMQQMFHIDSFCEDFVDCGNYTQCLTGSFFDKYEIPYDRPLIDTKNRDDFGAFFDTNKTVRYNDGGFK
jgi:hypothetical protein